MSIRVYLFNDSQSKSDYLGLNGRRIIAEQTLTCIIQPLTFDVTADGQRNFALKCFEISMPTPVNASFIPFILVKLHLIGHMFPIQPVKVNINLRDVGFEDGRWSKLTEDDV
jgi:hypothetical protein